MSRVHVWESDRAGFKSSSVTLSKLYILSGQQFPLLQKGGSKNQLAGPRCRVNETKFGLINSYLPFLPLPQFWNQCVDPMLSSYSKVYSWGDSRICSEVTCHHITHVHVMEMYIVYFRFCSHPAPIMTSSLFSTHQNSFHIPRPRSQPALW